MKCLFKEVMILTSVTAHYCDTYLLRKGDRIFGCNRRGNGNHIINEYDMFGNNLIKSSTVVEDCVAIIDVNEDDTYVFPYKEYVNSDGNGYIWTPYVRQVVKLSDYAPYNEASRYFHLRDWTLYTRKRVSDLFHNRS